MADAATTLVRKIAAEAYDELDRAGEPFTLALVADLVAGDPAVSDLGGQLVQMAAEAAVRHIDRDRTSQPEQAALFGDLDRVLALGDGLRRRKRFCIAANMAAHIAIVSENASRVAAAASVEQAEYARLLPYLTEGVTVEEAVAAYLADHPEVPA